MKVDDTWVPYLKLGGHDIWTLDYCVLFFGGCLLGKLHRHYAQQGGNSSQNGPVRIRESPSKGVNKSGLGNTAWGLPKTCNNGESSILL